MLFKQILYSYFDLSILCYSTYREAKVNVRLKSTVALLFT